MAPKLLLLCAIFEVCVLNLVAAGWMDAWSGWSSTPPANCTDEDPVTHECSYVKEQHYPCFIRKCCEDMHDDEEVTRHAGPGDDVEDETHDNCDSTCLVWTWCQKYKCATGCCDGYEEDWWDGTCHEVKELVCENGGTKIDMRGWSYCECPSDFQGETCQKPRCRPYCRHGKCVIKDGTSACKCTDGYYGELCNHYDSDLECQNGGTRMLSMAGVYKCKCTDDFKGRTCEQPICSPSCWNGGKCVNDEGKPECDCPDDYDGDYCQNLEDDSESSEELECENGGTRIDRRLYSYCLCTADFKGETCEKPKCRPRCRNDGECIISDGKPACECPEGYFGKQCQHFPTPKPTTKAPTPRPTTKAPTPRPTTKAPTPRPTTKAPTPRPTTKAPTPKPTTKAPTPRPTTKAPTPRPTTKAPTPKPTTKAPTPKPTTKAPTQRPTTKAPTPRPTTKAPTPKPTTAAPTQRPSTKAPTPRPTTKAPTRRPTTQKRTTTRAPTPWPTTSTPRPTTAKPAPVRPTITCPRNTISLSTVPNQNWAKLTKQNTRVIAYDSNSQKLQVSLHPFYVDHCACSNTQHVTKITATAVDRNGFSASCTLNVHIYDTQRPKFTSCPGDVMINVGESMPEPTASDNVGVQKEICIPALADVLHSPGNHAVRCRAWDYNWNEATCFFNINVQKKDGPNSSGSQGRQEHDGRAEPTTEDQEGGVNYALIIGPILGALLLIAALVGLLCCLRKKKLMAAPPIKMGKGAIPKAHNVVAMPKVHKKEAGPKKHAKTPASQGFDNHIYNMPFEGKFPSGPPSYASLSGPPSVIATRDMKGCEYMYITPPTYAESLYGKAPSYVSSGYDSVRSVNTVRSKVSNRTSSSMA